MRAYASVQVRKALFDERMNMATGRKTREQAASIPYEIDRRGRYAIMPKAQMKTQGLKSPDIFDTHCFFFLCDYIPVGDSQDIDEKDQFQKWAAEILEGGE